MKQRLLLFLLLLCTLSVSALAAETESPCIAIIDTGISTQAVDESHIAQGINYIRPQDDTEDKMGHGTAIAAIIAGSEKARIAGICPEAQLVPLVYCSQNEEGLEVRGDSSMVAQAIYDAIDVYGCRIINLSSGTDTDTDSLRNAAAYAERKNVLIVSCAGNHQQQTPNALSYPGAYGSVLCVGSANSDGSIASFSQQNDTVDLLALGTDLRLATVKGTRIRGEGTSFSTAIVTGAAAKIWTRFPELTVSELRAAVLDCTRTVGDWQVLDLDLVESYTPNAEEQVTEETPESTPEDTPEDMPEVQFLDLENGAYYHDAVLWAVENGITAGTSETTFSPNGITTRGQVVTFLWRAAGCPEPTAMSSFSDVSADSYYAKAVAWAVENGITSGVGDNRFAPDAECSRGQIVTFLYRFNGMDTMNIKDNPFTDVAEGSFYYDAVLWAYENGITSGTSADTFGPAGSCLRGQVVTFLYRLMAK